MVLTLEKIDDRATSNSEVAEQDRVKKKPLTRTIQKLTLVRRSIARLFTQWDMDMNTYTLNTSFSNSDLERFYATGTNIVIAKPPTAVKPPHVAWIVYRPLQQNSISWEEEYGIYASNQDIVNGARLYQTSKTDYPANIGKLYTLQPDGNLSKPGINQEPASYSVINEYNNLPKGYMTVGLYQDATIDGQLTTANAVSAAPVLYRSTATITPYTTVYIWTQSQIKSSTVVTDVTSTITQVKFGGDISTISLKYDAFTGKFIRTDTNEFGLDIDYIIPKLN